MIDRVCGTVIGCSEDSVIVMLQGIGFELYTPQATAYALNSMVTLYTYLHWNAEQGPSLFGFTDSLDRQVFLLIIGCSGIGPKIALSILSSLGSGGCIQAIAEHDEKALSKVPGIGAKKAEQIIVQLKHKVQKLLQSGVTFEGRQSLQQIHELADVLTSLNYGKKEIDMTVQWIKDQPMPSEPLPFDKLVRQALSFLAKKA